MKPATFQRLCLAVGMAIPSLPALAQQTALERSSETTASSKSGPNASERAFRLLKVASKLGGAERVFVAIEGTSQAQLDKTMPREAAGPLGVMYREVRQLVPELLADVNKGGDSLSVAELKTLEEHGRHFEATMDKVSAAGVDSINLPSTARQSPKAPGDLAAYQAVMAATRLNQAGFSFDAPNRFEVGKGMALSILNEAGATGNLSGDTADVLGEVTAGVTLKAIKVAAATLNIMRVGAKTVTSSEIDGLATTTNVLEQARDEAVQRIRQSESRQYPRSVNMPAAKLRRS